MAKHVSKMERNERVSILSVLFDSPGKMHIQDSRMQEMSRCLQKQHRPLIHTSKEMFANSCKQRPLMYLL